MDSFSYVIQLCRHYLFRNRTFGRRIVCSHQTRITHSNWLLESMYMRPILGVVLRLGLVSGAQSKVINKMTSSGVKLDRCSPPIWFVICACIGNHKPCRKPHTNYSANHLQPHVSTPIRVKSAVKSMVNLSGWFVEVCCCFVDDLWTVWMLLNCALHSPYGVGYLLLRVKRLQTS